MSPFKKALMDLNEYSLVLKFSVEKKFTTLADRCREEITRNAVCATFDIFGF